ncbi:MAG: cell division ATP-binding protein FtsE [Candidatus Flemingiibacterium sp.]
MIEFKDVKKIYPNGTVALNGVDLKIADGEFVFIVGESGAGKTTLMKLLLREEKISGGNLTVRVNRQVGNKNSLVEYDLSKLSNFKVPYYRRELGVVFQDFRLFPNKTVFENVAFAMQVVGESSKVIKRRVPALLNIVNLTDKMNSYPNQLSGGEQQRVALARALANNPQIIIADEPTGNIDPKMSLEIMNLLIKIHKRGKTVIVVTHEKDLVDYFKQRVVKIQDGKVISDQVGGMKL